MPAAKPKPDIPPLSFNDALKRLWASPPQHHKAQKPAKRKAKRAAK